MTESEKAIVRACLEQTLLALGEARQILAWWESLGPMTRNKYREFQELSQALRRNLDAVVEVGRIG